MNNFIIIFLFFLICNVSMHSQEYNCIYKNIIEGNTQFSVEKTDSSFVIFGITNSNNFRNKSNQNLQEPFVIEFDNKWNTIKEKRFSISGFDESMGFFRTPDSCWIVLLLKDSSNFSLLERYTMIMKIDNDYNLLWNKELPIIPNSIVQDSSGNIYLFGYYENPEKDNSTYEKIYKMNSSGIIQFSNKYDNVDYVNYGYSCLFIEGNKRLLLLGEVSIKNKELNDIDISVLDPFRKNGKEYIYCLKFIDNNCKLLDENYIEYQGLIQNVILQEQSNEIILFGNEYGKEKKFTINSFYDYSEVRNQTILDVNPKISCIDSLGNEKWSRVISNKGGEFFDVSNFFNDSFIYTFRNYHSDTLFVNINSNNGIELYHHKISTIKYYIYNLEILPLNKNKVLILISSRKKNDKKMLSDINIIEIEIP